MNNYTRLASIRTRQELADLYEVHRNTLLRWLKKADISLSRRRLMPDDVKKVIRALGPPPSWSEMHR